MQAAHGTRFKSFVQNRNVHIQYLCSCNKKEGITNSTDLDLQPRDSGKKAKISVVTFNHVVRNKIKIIHLFHMISMDLKGERLLFHKMSPP